MNLVIRLSSADLTRVCKLIEGNLPQSLLETYRELSARDLNDYALSELQAAAIKDMISPDNRLNALKEQYDLEALYAPGRNH